MSILKKFYQNTRRPESVERSWKVNREAILEGRAAVRQASVSSLPFGDGEFDIATAFETVCFWPDLLHDFMEVRRVLKEDGVFFICNEISRPDRSEKWIKMLDLSVWTGDELSETLRRAGFGGISCHGHSNGEWLCVTAQKLCEPDRRSKS